jgi:hypothetical protein
MAGIKTKRKEEKDAWAKTNMYHVAERNATGTV